MFELLPKEICQDIFMRLPLKSLVICACTSKSLRTFITSPDFVTMHSKKAKDDPFVFFSYFIYSDKERGKTREYFGLHPDNDSLTADFNVAEMPITDRANNYFTIMGSCNGVVCLSDDEFSYTNIIYLWNPSIRKSLLLPYPNFNFGTCGPYDMCAGFGFDKLTNDYKVVRLVYRETEYAMDVYYPLAEVFSVNSMSWRRVEAPGPIYSIRNYSFDSCRDPYSQCFLNGVVHWPGYMQRSSVWSAFVTFNVHEESFGKMKLPDCLEGISVRDFYLTVTVCKDMLALIRMTHSRSSESRRTCIWVMVEYGNVDSWTVLFSFDDPAKYPRPLALYFRKNMDILMLAKVSPVGSWLIRSKPNIRLLKIGNNRAKVEDLGVVGESFRGLYLGSYNEGLALFNEAKAIRNEEVENDENGANKVVSD